MASEAFYSGNVAKVIAGGSGDNYIPDGYVKSVEKVWIDSKTVGSAGVTDAATDCVISLARIPTGKKVTSIELTIETLATQSNGTISLGTADDPDAFMAAVTINHALSYSTVAWPTNPLYATDAGGQLDVGKPTTWPGVTDGSDVVVELKAWANTGATITSIVRYT